LRATWGELFILIEGVSTVYVVKDLEDNKDSVMTTTEVQRVDQVQCHSDEKVIDRSQHG